MGLTCCRVVTGSPWTIGIIGLLVFSRGSREATADEEVCRSEAGGCTTGAGAGAGLGSAEWEHVKISKLTYAALLEDWNVFDPGAEKMIATFKEHPSFFMFPHARDVFRNHLVGTFSILGQWNQPEDIKRTGNSSNAKVVHTAIRSRCGCTAFDSRPCNVLGATVSPGFCLYLPGRLRRVCFH